MVGVLLGGREERKEGIELKTGFMCSLEMELLNGVTTHRCNLSLLAGSLGVGVGGRDNSSAKLRRSRGRGIMDPSWVTGPYTYGGRPPLISQTQPNEM